MRFTVPPVRFASMIPDAIDAATAMAWAASPASPPRSTGRGGRGADRATDRRRVLAVFEVDGLPLAAASVVAGHAESHCDLDPGGDRG